MKNEILDVQYDSKQNRIYVLNSAFVLEGWDLMQETTSPISKIRIGSSDSSNLPSFNSSLFSSIIPPTWLSLYEDGCIVNCLGFFTFIDGKSFCAEKKVYLNLKDFKLSISVMRTITRLKNQLKEMEQNNTAGVKEGWEEEDEGRGRGRMPRQEFGAFLKRKFGNSLKDDVEVRELVEFLNQNNDEYISRQEYEFLFEIARNMESSSTKNLKINVNLGVLTRKARSTLENLANFVRKEGLSLETAFKIFDKNGNGRISYFEFYEMLDKVTERSMERSMESSIKNSRELSDECSVPHDIKEELARLIDKDRNGIVTFHEFKSVFEGVVDQKTARNEDIRQNIMLCFQHVCFFQYYFINYLIFFLRLMRTILM
jgi:Ca2+-binding EF-hand superfamily protein